MPESALNNPNEQQFIWTKKCHYIIFNSFSTGQVAELQTINGRVGSVLFIFYVLQNVTMQLKPFTIYSAGLKRSRKTPNIGEHSFPACFVNKLTMCTIYGSWNYLAMLRNGFPRNRLHSFSGRRSKTGITVDTGSFSQSNAFHACISYHRD